MRGPRWKQPSLHQVFANVPFLQVGRDGKGGAGASGCGAGELEGAVGGSWWQGNGKGSGRASGGSEWGG